MKLVFRTSILLLGALIIMFFNSCGNNGENISEKIRTRFTEYLVNNFSKTKEERLADASMENIKICIDNKDQKAFKELFSNNVVNAEHGLNQQLQSLFDLFPNGIVKYSRTSDGGVSDGWEAGSEYYEIMRKFVVSNDTDQYALILTERIKDTDNTDNVGIKSIFVFKSDEESLFDNWFYGNDYVGNRDGIVIYTSNQSVTN